MASLVSRPAGASERYWECFPCGWLPSDVITQSLTNSVTARPVDHLHDRLRFPRFPSKLEKRGNAHLRPHIHRHPTNEEN